jgi:hypothetical protein
MGRFHQARQFLGWDECDILGTPPAHNHDFVVIRHLFQD